MKKSIIKRFLAFTLPVVLMTGMLAGCQSKQDKTEEALNPEDEMGGAVALTVWCASEDEELKSFLFSLGCYSGEPITVISHLKGGCVVSIKDGRYNIDTDLAKTISI